MEVINVNTKKSYDIIVGEDILNNIGEILNRLTFNKVMIITDNVVSELYMETVYNSIKNSGKQVYTYEFKNGEKSKNFDTYFKIINSLADNEFDRGDLVLALGGGVVGDIAGFVASTYMRGIKCVQVPTTLLAQVDSSVGGKTAIDLPQGKNLVGTFYQPSLVVCDISTLKSLPKQIFLDGMGEVAKYAFLDKKIYNLLNNNGSLLQVVTACINCKREIVERDEFESGDRKLLNLGHTIAHAIEKLSNYSISHGMAVGMGLKVVLNSALKNGYINNEQCKNMLSCIEKCVGDILCPYSIEEMVKCMSFDKKRDNDYIDFVAIHDIGDVRIEKIKLSKIKEYLI